jgi:hypothetical protein
MYRELSGVIKGSNVEGREGKGRGERRERGDICPQIYLSKFCETIQCNIYLDWN